MRQIDSDITAHVVMGLAQCHAEVISLGYFEAILFLYDAHSFVAPVVATPSGFSEI